MKKKSKKETISHKKSNLRIPFSIHLDVFVYDQPENPFKRKYTEFPNFETLLPM